MIALNCKNVSKSFGKVSALKNVSLELEENRIYGLLGRNGAGKTTLLRTIGNELFADTGSITVYDSTVPEGKNTLGSICFVKDSTPYLKELKLRDILKIASESYKNWDIDFAKQLTAMFNMDTNKKYFNMSNGMKTTVGIIVGLASRAPLTIYDEPYLGLDAAARQKFYDILSSDFYENPRTVLFSTHLIDEMSRLFEKIIILDRGSVIFNEETEDLRGKAFYVSGKKELVDEFSKGKNILHEETIGSLKSTAVLFDSPLITDNIQNSQLEFTAVPLQKLFIYLTENEGSELYE
jgi:ABC-2 type transport system ATP-binding protein